MSSSLAKRPAGDSPNGRPSKRLMSSSPEEGELDDQEPPPPPPARRTPPLPPTTAASKAPSKVPFPFKKKAAPATGHSDGVPPPPPPRDSYGRPGDYDRRYRDEDVWRGSNGRGPSREDGRPPWTGDHWVAGQDSRGPLSSRPPRRDPYDDRYPLDDRDRLYRPRDNGGSSWEPRRAHTLVSPPRNGAPLRRTRSPSSPRSRSPLSPGTPGHELHRLPRSFADEMDTRGEYVPERGEYREERWRGASPTSNGLSNEDRYYRPRDTWARREQSPDSIRREERGRYSRPRDDSRSLTLTSPRGSPRPRSPESLNGRAKTPPPPPPPIDDAPPPPEADERPTFLPNTHAAVKIALPKKPPTPRERSPKESILTGKDNHRSEGDSARHRSETSHSTTTKPVKPRRKPVQRTREEEMTAYGRVFQGCGQQSDYEVTTKLGEGTFGYIILLFDRGVH